MREEQVKEHVLTWVSRRRRGENWVPKAFKAGKHHGADLMFEQHGHQWIIEVKGDPVRDNYITSALGELVTRITRLQAQRYSVAFPVSYRDKVLHRIPWQAAERLKGKRQRYGLSILLVGKDGDVEEYLPRDLKRLQPARKQGAH